MRLFSRVVPYVALILLFAVSLIVLKLFVLNGMHLLEHDPKAMDFLAFYTGASMLFQNHSEMYNLLEQIRIQYTIIPIAQTTNVFLPFFNPPFVAFFLAPLALVPILYAYTLWTGVNIIFLVLICFLIYRHIQSSKTIKIISIIGVLTFIPTLSSLLLGQLTFIVTFVVVLSWVLLKRGDEFKSGLLLSLLLMKPHFFLLPFLAFLIQRRWTFMKGFLLGTGILIAISIGVLGIDGINDYVQLLTNAATWNSGYGIDIKAQHSLQTLFLIIFQTDSLGAIRMAWSLTVIAIVLVTLYFWRKQYSLSSQAFSMQFAMLIFAALLISPHTHFHDFMLLIPAGVALSTIFTKPQLKHTNIISAFIYLGYFVCLSGYILELYFLNTSRLGWIVITVSYLLLFWLLLLYSLTKIKKK